LIFDLTSKELIWISVCAHNLTLCTKLLSFCILISSSTNSFFLTSNYINKDDSATVDIDSGSYAKFEASQQSQFSQTIHTKQKEKDRKSKRSKSKSRKPLRDIATSPSANIEMVQTKAQALAVEHRKTKKAQQDKAEAEQEKAEAQAENACLKEQLRLQLAQLKEKSGCSSSKSVATAPSKKRKETPSTGSVAHKSQRSAGAKRQCGGRRQNNKDGVPDEMLTHIHTAINVTCLMTASKYLGQKARKNSSKLHSSTSRWKVTMARAPESSAIRHGSMSCMPMMWWQPLTKSEAAHPPSAKRQPRHISTSTMENCHRWRRAVHCLARAMASQNHSYLIPTSSCFPNMKQDRGQTETSGHKSQWHPNQDLSVPFGC